MTCTRKHPKILFTELEQAVQHKMFTAWSAGNTSFECSAFFADEYLPQENRLHPVFDLASLSKPILSGLWVLKNLLQNENISSEILQLWMHEFGVAPWIWFGKAIHGDKKNIIPKLIQICLEHKKYENKIIYSDLSYFLLPHFIAPKSSSSFWQDFLNSLNEELHTHFTHASLENISSYIPFFPYISSENAYFEEHPPFMSFGKVHDTNAHILAEHHIISSHAGIFGNISDITSFMIYLNHIFQKNPHFIEKYQNKEFICGLDTNRCLNSTSGIEDLSLGHLGYTGTSFWIHPSTRRGVSLLTNRTAKRLYQGATSVPRMYLYSSNKNHFFYREDSQISQEEFILTCQEHSSSTLRFWDMSVIQLPKILAQIRRNTHKKLWEEHFS